MLRNMNSEEWKNFFCQAGIPDSDAATYAHMFTRNCIQPDMLTDLNKDYLMDMGFTIMGHIIAILRYTKVIYENTTNHRPTNGKELVTKLLDEHVTKNFKMESRKYSGDSTTTITDISKPVLLNPLKRKLFQNLEAAVLHSIVPMNYDKNPDIRMLENSMQFIYPDGKTQSQAVFTFKMHEFSKTIDAVLSPPCMIRNITWQIMIAPTVTDFSLKSLGFFLISHNECEDSSWRCHVTAALIVTCNKENKKSLVKKFDHIYTEEDNKQGFRCFVDWDYISDQKNGFIEGDTICFQAHLTLDAPQLARLPSKKLTKNQIRCNLEKNVYRQIDTFVKFDVDQNLESIVDEFWSEHCSCFTNCTRSFTKAKAASLRCANKSLDKIVGGINCLDLVLLGIIRVLCRESLKSQPRRHCVLFMIEGVAVCKDFFLFTYGIDTNRWAKLLYTYNMPVEGLVEKLRMVFSTSKQY